MRFRAASTPPEIQLHYQLVSSSTLIAVHSFIQVLDSSDSWMGVIHKYRVICVLDMIVSVQRQA